ncbi:hypothetical protein [Embleya sp. NPDC001921]
MRIAKPGLDTGQVRMRTDVPDATPPDGMLPGTVRIGPVVDVKPSVPVADAEIRFSFDPERDLPNGTGEQPSTLTNAYIAIWEGALGLWFPLETRYDGTTRELVATAPHFSLLSAIKVRPGRLGIPTIEYTGVTKGIDALKAAVDKAADEMIDAYKDVKGEFPDDKRIDCGNANGSPSTRAGVTVTRVKDIAVTPDKSWIRACVVDIKEDQKPTRRALRIENRRKFPLAIEANGAFDVGWSSYDARRIDDAHVMLARYFESLAGDSMVPRLNSAELPFTDKTPAAARVALEFAALTTTFDVIFGLMSAAKSVDDGAKVLARIFAELVPVGRHSADDFLVRARRMLDDRQFAEPGRSDLFTAANGLLDAMGCAKRIWSTLEEHSGRRLANLVRECVAVGLDRIGRETAAFAVNTLKGMLNSAKSVFEVADLLRELGEFKAPSAVVSYAPTLPDGVHDVLLASVDTGGRTIVVDPLTVLWGEEARAACIKAGETLPDSGDWCNEYYSINPDKTRLRLTFTAKTKFTTAHDTTCPLRKGNPDTPACPSTAEKVRDYLRPESPKHFQVEMKDNVVVSVNDIFYP